MFFPVSELDTRQVEAAKGICQGCPVQGSCLQFALDNGEHGIWGGTTEDERRRLRRLRRKDNTAGQDGSQEAAA